MARALLFKCAGAADGAGARRWRRSSPALARVVFGWFCVRLSGVYLAMLTLAFAQIAWSIAFQWDELTGGSNGLVGVWPSPWLAGKRAYYYLALVAVRRRHRAACGARSSRRSATRCAPAAIRRCAPRRSASTCAPSNGWPS